MIEIRFHGRGGQGAVIASNILAESAFREGKDVQAFPYFGVERRGAPVTAFTRIDDRPIRIKSQIYEPDYVVVLDQSLITSMGSKILQGLKKGGSILINSVNKPSTFNIGVDAKVATIDATSIAIKHGVGSKNAPIVNTAIVGAFAKLSGIVKIESVVASVKDNVPVKKEENANATKEAYDKVVV